MTALAKMQPLTHARAAWSFVRLVRDPNRLDEVFHLSDRLSRAHPEVLAIMANHVRRTPEGAEALRARPRLGKVDLEALAALPEGSLGRAFAEFLRARNLDPADIPTLPGEDEVGYVRAHLYETHDLWHVLTGFETDVAGELGLQAFYAAQLPGRLPIALLAMGMLNTFIYADGDRDPRLTAIGRGYALGKRAKPLFGVDWAARWAAPLSEVRASLGLGAEVS
jgi:ubiquinone biosynthesis protein Coq4